MTDRQPSRRGRPRDKRTHDAVLAATRAILLEHGYPALTIEAVAARAETARTTVYRSWPTKGELVLDAAGDDIAIGVVPDTGSTRGDLEIAVRQLTEAFSRRIVGFVGSPSYAGASSVIPLLAGSLVFYGLSII